VTGTVGSGGKINNMFAFSADFESAYPLTMYFSFLP